MVPLPNDQQPGGRSEHWSRVDITEDAVIIPSMNANCIPIVYNIVSISKCPPVSQHKTDVENPPFAHHSPGGEPRILHIYEKFTLSWGALNPHFPSSQLSHVIPRWWMWMAETCWTTFRWPLRKGKPRLQEDGTVARWPDGMLRLGMLMDPGWQFGLGSSWDPDLEVIALVYIYIIHI